MAAEGERPAGVNYNNLDLEHSDVNETIAQEEKEVIQPEKTAQDFDKEKAPTLRSPKSSAQDRLVTRLQNELEKQADRSKAIQDTVKGIQKQLVRIDKTLYSFRKEHQVDRSKSIQDTVKGIQKRVDSLDKSIKTWKSKTNAVKRKIKPKLRKKNK